jgi:ABC-type glycerol-3-phosphate transport system substrate-binding protein
MKNITLIMSVLLLGLLVACGAEEEKSEAKEANPEADAKALCDCYEKAEGDEAATVKCTELWADHMKKYQGNKEQEEQYNAIARKCGS